MDIVEIVCSKKEDGNVYYDLKLKKKKIGYIKILENSIINIWVEKKNQKKGYGTMLLHHVESIAKIACNTRMHVEAVATDVALFFKKNGYILTKDTCGEYTGKKILKNDFRTPLLL